MKYPYKTEAQKIKCAEIQKKADAAAENIKFAANKKLAVKTFLQLLHMSI